MRRYHGNIRNQLDCLENNFIISMRPPRNKTNYMLSFFFFFLYAIQAFGSATMGFLSNLDIMAYVYGGGGG